MTAEGTVTRRSTRRNLTTQPIPRGVTGRPTAGQTIRHTPISPDELADIITAARAERIETDIQNYARRKAS